MNEQSVDEQVTTSWVPRVQVKEDHYSFAYDSFEAWTRHYWAIQSVMEVGAKSVLDIGVGSKVVNTYLRNQGLSVTTLDIDPALEPDHVGSVTEMPFTAGSFDAVICCEVLEHMPWPNSCQGIKEIHRVTKKFAFVSVPHFVLTLSFLFRAPVIQAQEIRLRIPYPKKPPIPGEHYWELGRLGYPRKKLRQQFEQAGFHILNDHSPRTNYSAAFFKLRKREESAEQI